MDKSVERDAQLFPRPLPREFLNGIPKGIPKWDIEPHITLVRWLDNSHFS